MFGRHRKKLTLLFALADGILAVSSFETAYYIRLRLPLEHAFFIDAPTRTLLLAAIVALWVGTALLLRIYDRLQSTDLPSLIADAVKQAVTASLLLMVFLFVEKLDISRLFVALLGAFTVVGMVAYRVSARYLGRRFGGAWYFLIVGTGPTARQVGAAFEQAAEHGIQLQAFVHAGEQPESAEITLKKRYPVYPLRDLARILRKQVVDEIIFAVDREKLSELEHIFLLCDEEGVRTRVVVNFFPHVNSEVFLDQFGSFSLLTFSATPHDEMRLFAKRLLDFVLALAALLVLALPMVVFAALVKLTSHGPAIFKQVRCGLNGRMFTFYKLRSMCQDAEIKKADLERLNERDGPVFKMSKDPRLTLLGRYLRRFSIDEWPQLWNVLKGDMSMVGPRPALPAEVEQYKPWQRRRLRMKPGLTCLWVLSGRDHIDFETWMRLDMEYIDNWSLWLDLKILLRSFPRVLLGRGAS